MFGNRHRWSGGVKDFNGVMGDDRPGNRLRVHVLEGRFIDVRGEDTAHGV